MFDNMTIEGLVNILKDVPPVDLKALTLMRQADVKPGQVFPRGLEREQYIEAFTEWTAYLNQCTETAKLLIQAMPTVAAALPVEEYAL